MPSWKKISSKKVFSSPNFSVFEDKVERPDGSAGRYFIIQQRPGVVIIPVDGEKIYLVNQYRYAMKKRCWELPGGKAENKNFLLQAKKELAEETGFRAARWKYLGQYSPTNATSNRIGKIFLAQGLKSGQPNREPGESDMYTKAFTLSQIDNMIVAGKIIDGWTIVATYFFKQYLSKSK